jgi:hypothetical protein
MGIAQQIRTGILYGLIMFAVGFALGAVRELLLIPMLGSDAGHLAEFPVILAATVLVAHWLVARREAGTGVTGLLLVGLVGVIVLVALESGLALLVLGRTLEQYLATYDVLAGALMPWGLLVMLASPAALRIPMR